MQQFHISNKEHRPIWKMAQFHICSCACFLLLLFKLRCSLQRIHLPISSFLANMGKNLNIHPVSLESHFETSNKCNY